MDILGDLNIIDLDRSREPCGRVEHLENSTQAIGEVGGFSRPWRNDPIDLINITRENTQLSLWLGIK